jgi:rare lipoprotein A
MRLLALCLFFALALAQTYTVKPGDTLYRIAKAHGLTVGGEGPKEPRGRFFQEGLAVWYGPGFHGKRTASGEIYDMHALTAAHPTLPFGTWVRVTNPKNGRSVVVRINDRGPFGGRYIIDLSYAAAKAIGALSATRVRLEVLEE